MKYSPLISVFGHQEQCCQFLTWYRDIQLTLKKYILWISLYSYHNLSPREVQQLISCDICEGQTAHQIKPVLRLCSLFTSMWNQAVNSQNALQQNLSRILSQAAGLSLRRKQVQTRSWLRWQRATGSQRRSSYRLNIPDINGHHPSELQRPLSWVHSAQRVKPHRSVLREKKHHRSKYSDYAQENPLAERR